MSYNKPKTSSETPKVLFYNKNNQVDSKSVFTDYVMLSNAMERGDLMHPKIQTTPITSEILSGKKRKNPFDNDTLTKNKKARYE